MFFDNKVFLIEKFMDVTNASLLLKNLFEIIDAKAILNLFYFWHLSCIFTLVTRGLVNAHFLVECVDFS